MRNKIETDLLMGELIYKHLSGEISKDEKELLDSWVENEENTGFFSSLNESDRLYEGMIQVQYQDTDAQFRKLQRKIEKKKFSRQWPWWTGIAALLFISIGALWFFRKQQPEKIQSFELAQEACKEDQTILKTPEGKVVYLADTVKEITSRGRKEKAVQLPVQNNPSAEAALKYNTLATSSQGKIEVMLSDSSRVWLNAGSELKYPDVFGRDNRVVYLKGEAYFEVAKNPRRPFIVRAGNMKVEVLGTQFNVKMWDESHGRTTLVEGAVRLYNGEGRVAELTPGQRAEADKDGRIQVTNVDVRYDIAWKKDQFAFHEETLFGIMKELAAWYGVTFNFENIGLANQVYTAIIPRAPEIDDVLQILQSTNDFVYKYDRDGHISILKK